ncbi:MAG TPA: hypothetical protein VK439_16735 [Rubrivivax sp.]|jgi:hypothetical protein|nr:hypothetical protein [Rubrivivax sp.]
MKLLQALLSPRPQPHPQPPVPTPPIAPGTVADRSCDRDRDDHEGDEQRSGCGWFDSSHDLRAGLQVREHAANDAVLAELPLAMWLELQHT